MTGENLSEPFDFNIDFLAGDWAEGQLHTYDKK